MKILFHCQLLPALAWMGRVLLERAASPRVEAWCNAGDAVRLPQGAVQALAETGLDLGKFPAREVGDPASGEFDLVITLCREGKEGVGKEGSSLALLLSDPILLDWSLPVLPGVEGGGSVKEWREARDFLEERIRTFLEQGYLAALARQRARRNLLVESLEVGILIHDENRRIAYFNRAAEKILGLPRKDVLGKDCRQVFGPLGLCGKECAFLPGRPALEGRKKHRSVFLDDRGRQKRLKITRMPMEVFPGRAPGVLALIEDVTEVEALREKVEKDESFHGIVGVSPVMQAVFQTIRQVALSDYPVLITGESGTGKELVAQAIHEESPRKDGPFVPVNCGALPENILESELFGHVRGAFTGAIRDKKGRFELAHGGTLFLDEVGELSPALQVKLLRVLQEKRFEKVGGEQTVTVDVRIVSATNRDLGRMVREGRFREDFFYRLRVVPIELPPLRNRKEDLPLLVEQVLSRVRRETGKPIHGVSREVMDLFYRYPWPGNVRELINALQFASIGCDGETILVEHLPLEIRNPQAQPSGPLLPGALLLEGPLPSRPNRKLDAAKVAEALRLAGGNKVRAARILGVGRATLYRFLKDNPLPAEE